MKQLFVFHQVTLLRIRLAPPHHCRFFGSAKWFQQLFLKDICRPAGSHSNPQHLRQLAIQAALTCVSDMSKSEYFFFLLHNLSGDKKKKFRWGRATSRSPFGLRWQFSLSWTGARSTGAWVKVAQRGGIEINKCVCGCVYILVIGSARVLPSVNCVRDQWQKRPLVLCSFLPVCSTQRLFVFGSRIKAPVVKDNLECFSLQFCQPEASHTKGWNR